MTVQELIDELKKWPRNREVVMEQLDLSHKDITYIYEENPLFSKDEKILVVLS
jgi:hypothetical protein